MPGKSSVYVRPSFNVVGGVVLLTGALWVARSVLIPVALAILLTFILMPLVVALQRRGLSRTYAVLLVALLTLVAVVSGVASLSKQLHSLAEELPTHQGNIANKLKDLQGEGPGVFERLSKMAEDIGADLHPSPTSAAASRTFVSSRANRRGYRCCRWWPVRLSA